MLPFRLIISADKIVHTYIRTYIHTYIHTYTCIHTQTRTHSANSQQRELELLQEQHEQLVREQAQQEEEQLLQLREVIFDMQALKGCSCARYGLTCGYGLTCKRQKAAVARGMV